MIRPQRRSNIPRTTARTQWKAPSRFTVEHIVPPGAVHHQHVGVARHASVVDQDVDRPERRDGGIEKGGDGVSVADIARPRPGAATGLGDLRRDGFALIGPVAIRDRDRRALCRQHFRDAPADSPRATRDDRDPATQFSLEHRPEDRSKESRASGVRLRRWLTTRTRRTAANIAPPDATLLIMTTGPGDGRRAVARSIVDAAGSTCDRFAIGGTNPARPHRTAAAQAAAPDAPHSPTVPLIDVTTGRCDAKTGSAPPPRRDRALACRSRRHRPRRCQPPRVPRRPAPRAWS